MLFVLGVLIFLVGIGLSIGLHEIGHLLPAKLFGVKVTQYMVGFGPTVWSRRRGETEYGVKAVPLGGYIRMIGMYPPAPGSDGTTLRTSTTGRFANLVESARAASFEEIPPEDADRVFYKLPVHKRIVVMLGGPTMNLIIALVLFVVVLCGIGIFQQTATATVGSVVPCSTTATNTSGALDAQGTCGTGHPSPAQLGGLQPGDVIVSFDGTPVSTWDDLLVAIQKAPQAPVPVVVERNGSTVTLTVPVSTALRPVTGPDGAPTRQTETKNFVGIGAAGEYVRQPVSAVPSFVWTLTTESVQKIVTLPARMWDLVRQTFTSEQRDPNGIVGVVGVTRLSGDVVALQNTPVIDKTAQVLFMLAGLNLFLFLFNLIPLLPLDGGHVAGALWEAVKRGWARLRHLPDPGPVDIAKALPLTYAMSIVLIFFGAITIVADLVKPITIGG
ncbi:MAG: PDZ domain-containing protein [Frankiales bacterium]|nr:PDZ domain-containing protein [Frankiales bacterium]